MLSYIPTSRYALSGVRRVLVAKHVAGTRFLFADPLQPLIASLSPTPTEWYVLSAEPTSNATQASTRTLAGQRHDQRVALQWSVGLSVFQRLALPQLFEQQLFCLVEDRNGNWWLAGQSRGLRCTNINWVTGVTNGETSVSATLEGAEPAAWKAFNTDNAISLYTAATPVGGEVGPGGGVE